MSEKNSYVVEDAPVEVPLKWVGLAVHILAEDTECWCKDVDPDAICSRCAALISLPHEVAEKLGVAGRPT